METINTSNSSVTPPLTYTNVSQDENNNRGNTQSSPIPQPNNNFTEIIEPTTSNYTPFNLTSQTITKSISEQKNLLNSIKSVKFKIGNTNSNGGSNIAPSITTSSILKKKEVSEVVTDQIVDSDENTEQGYHQMRLPDGQMVLLLPPHYVQLAAALGLNSQPMLEGVPTPTDFENLIEINRTQQNKILNTPNVESSVNSVNESFDSLYWENYKKSLASLSSMTEKLASVIDLNEKQQQTSKLSHRLIANIPHPKPAISEVTRMEVDDNLDERTPISLTTQSSFKKNDVQAYRSRSPYYEQNQNNQNLLNENVESRGSNGSDDSMWRPW